MNILLPLLPFTRFFLFSSITQTVTCFFSFRAPSRFLDGFPIFFLIPTSSVMQSKGLEWDTVFIVKVLYGWCFILNFEVDFDYSCLVTACPPLFCIFIFNLTELRISY